MMLTIGRSVDKNPGFLTCGIEDTQTPRAVSITCGVDTLNLFILFPHYFSFHILCLIESDFRLSIINYFIQIWRFNLIVS